MVPKRAVAAAKTLSGGIVFADPPYEEPKEYERLAIALAPEADSFDCIIFQHHKKQAVPSAIGLRTLTRELRQGDNVLSFYGFGDA
jgi:16S rRNA G966 N2-methylase RsmD